MGRFWVLLDMVPYSKLWTIWNKIIVSTLKTFKFKNAILDNALWARLI